MYAQIESESLLNYGTGKTSRVWAFADDITFEAFGQALRITASYKDKVTSGDRGGEYNPVTRRFLLVLDKAEIERLVATALHATLLREPMQEGLADNQVITLLTQIEALKGELAVLTEKNQHLEAKITTAVATLRE